MSVLLVKFHANWADEMNVNGWDIMEHDEWEKAVIKMNTAQYPLRIYIGTNEEIEFKSARELKSHYNVIEIDEVEESILNKLFGRYGERGIFKAAWEYLDDDNDGEEAYASTHASLGEE